MATGLPGPAGWSVFIPTGPEPDWKSFMATDPFYQQDIKWIDEDQGKASTRLIEDQGFDDRAYANAVAQANASANAGGDYGIAAAEAAARLAKEKAAHENANRAEYLREWLGSRGMSDSGQNAWEQNERTYQFDIYNRGVDEDLAGRVSSANQQRAAAQAALSARLADLALDRDKDLLDFQRDQADLPGFYARQRGTAAFNLWGRLNDSGQLKAPGIPAIWDEESGLYVSADGRTWGIGPDGKPFLKERTPAAGPAGGGGGGGGDGGGASTAYAPWSPDPYESRPSQNVPSGTWGYQ